MFETLKKILGQDTNRIPKPNLKSTLFHGENEQVCHQYMSMKDRTVSFFELSKANNSFQQYCDASMRLAAYSTVAIYGYVFYYVKDDLIIHDIEQSKLNDIIYSDFLIEIFDFSWLMLQHCIHHSSYGKQFSKDEIYSFLQSDLVAQGYPFILMLFLVLKENTEYADKKLKEEIKLKAQYGQNLDEYPSKQTKLAWDQMVDAKLIGDPNNFQAFNASHLLNTFYDVKDLLKISNKLEKSVIYKSLYERVSIKLSESFD
jgi:hypothetical protein